MPKATKDNAVKVKTFTTEAVCTSPTSVNWAFLHPIIVRKFSCSDESGTVGKFCDTKRLDRTFQIIQHDLFFFLHLGF